MLWITCTFLLVPCVLALIYEMHMPPDLMHCYQSFERKTNISATVGETIHHHCLRHFLWKSELVRWPGFNITQKDRDYINSLLDSFIHRRVKRQANGMMIPPTGFRIRREYRRINDMERMMFHEAINTLKMNGEYDTLANLHSGIVVTSAHGGPNFFGWHRIYITLLEEALRRVNPRVTLPYWDSSLDFDLTNPVDSLIWSPEFLGNGDGFVTTGSFANWQTPSGPLTRNIGGASRLISKEVIATILTRCMTAEISEPTAEMQYNLELAHGGPHVWVGGQMAGLNTAAHDPVFFLHHAFIDYIWERFRRRQSRVCGVTPETDYPMAMGLHAPDRPMDGFQRYRAVDGYMSFWTRFWFNYERSPWCSFWRPFCRTPYLRCDMRRQRCVALPRRTAVGTGSAREGRLGVGPLTALASANARVATATRGRAQESLVNVGPRFRAPPSDGRTNGAIRAAVRGFQQASDIIQVGLLGSSRASVGDNFGPIFNAPPSDGRTNDQRVVSRASSTASQNRWDTINRQENVADSAQTSGTFNAVNSLRPPIQNTFFLNGRSDIDLWTFIPVKIVHRRTETDQFASFPVHNGNPSTTEDIFSPFTDPNFETQPRQSQAKPYEHCKTDTSGARQIIVTSDGLNYMGTFSDYAIIDSRLPIASAMTYIGIKSPDKGSTEVLLAAHDTCGRMCEPHCFVKGSETPSYKPCTGVLRITSENPKQYGKTFGAAVDSVWQFNAGRLAEGNVPLMFYCTYVSWPWKTCNTSKGSIK